MGAATEMNCRRCPVRVGLGLQELSMPEESLIIGSVASQWVRVTPLRRTHPNCADYWDGNWVDSSVDVSVGAFAGKYKACLRTDELKMFRVGLDPLYTTLKGEASF